MRIFPASGKICRVSSSRHVQTTSNCPLLKKGRLIHAPIRCKDSLRGAVSILHYLSMYAFSSRWRRNSRLALSTVRNRSSGKSASPEPRCEPMRHVGPAPEPGPACDIRHGDESGTGSPSDVDAFDALDVHDPNRTASSRLAALTKPASPSNPLSRRRQARSRRPSSGASPSSVDTTTAPVHGPHPTPQSDSIGLCRNPWPCEPRVNIHDHNGATAAHRTRQFIEKIGILEDRNG